MGCRRAWKASLCLFGSTWARNGQLEIDSEAELGCQWDSMSGDVPRLGVGTGTRKVLHM